MRLGSKVVQLEVAALTTMVKCCNQDRQVQTSSVFNNGQSTHALDVGSSPPG